MDIQREDRGILQPQMSAHSDCKRNRKVKAESQVAGDAVLEADGLGVGRVAAVGVESE